MIHHDIVVSLMGVAGFCNCIVLRRLRPPTSMNAKRFALLPHGAVIVNSARGALIDEIALIAALDAGYFAAAGLDCFQTEPGGNLAFSVYDNIFMLPHIGSETNKRVAQWDF